MSVYEWMGAILISLGTTVLWLDLGNRLFGSYVRSPWRSGWRTVLVATACCFLLFPFLLIVFDIRLPSVQIWFWSAAVLGVVASVLFLCPPRFGIESCNSMLVQDTSEALVAGIRLRRVTWEVPDLPCESLCLFVLTDIHCNDGRTLTLLTDAVEKIADRPRDLVLLLGDFGEKKKLLPDVISLLAKIPSRHGAFAVMGNHDFEGGRKSLIESLLHEHHVRLLKDEACEAGIHGVTLLGIDRPWFKGRILGKPDGFTVGLSHSPDNLPLLDRLGIQFSVSGHTHGGGLHIPFVGPLTVPSRYGRLFTTGCYRKSDSVMYLSPGIGYFPGRHGHVGEIAEITLVPLGDVPTESDQNACDSPG